MPQAPRPIADNLARLDHWLLVHRPRYQRALLPGATAAELKRVHAQLGRPLPEDLQTLLSWHDGQESEMAGAFEESWLLMSAARIAAAKLDLDASSKQTGWQPAWVPFLDDDQGDYLCLDTSLPVAPLRLFRPGQTGRLEIAPSLAAWLDAFVCAVERAEYVVDPERGAFLRTSRA
jgi:cell wall assembly regulator SMI1